MIIYQKLLKREEDIHECDDIFSGYIIFIKGYLPKYGWCDDREKEDVLRG